MDEISKTLRLRAAWFENEDYQKGGFPGDLIRPLAGELRMAAYKIETLATENTLLRQFVKDTVEGMECLDTCDSSGHDDLCPVVNPVEAWRQLRQEKAKLVEALEEVKKRLENSGVDFDGILDVVDATLDKMEE